MSSSVKTPGSKITHHGADIAPGERDLRADAEFLFRRCNSAEAQSMINAQRLTNGNAQINMGIGREKSDRDKWISRNPRFALRYDPRNADPEMYREIVVFEVKQGTSARLEEMKGKEVKRGPSGAYGISPEMVGWFNDQILSVSSHNMGTGQKPKLVPLRQGFNILVDQQGNPCYFIAFAPDLLTFNRTCVNFSDDINLLRMTWLKTSLLWTVWRSEFATKAEMSRLIKLTLPPKYMDYLVQSAISTKENKDSDDIVFQKDPDRVPLAAVRNGDASIGFLPFEFKRTGSTVHFGIRGSALLELVTDLSRGNMVDITDPIQNFFFHCKLASEAIPKALYSRLGLRQTEYQGGQSAGL